MCSGSGMKAAVLLSLILAIWEFISVSLPASITNAYELYPNGNWGVPYDLWSNWLGGEMLSLPSYLYRLLLPVLSVLPFATSYSTDTKGYHYQLLSRTNKGSYLRSKIFAVWCGAGIASILPLLFSFLFATAVLPLRGPNRVSMNLVGSNQIFGELFAKTPLLYLTLWILVIFVFCGSIAFIALFISLFVKNTFIIMITPFTLYLGADVVARRIVPTQADSYLPMQFLHPQQWLPGRPDIIITELVILLLVGLLFYILAIRKDAL